MVRIPDTEIERLKAEVSLVRLVESAGVKLARKGKDELSGRCPFHDDDTPSLSVNAAKNLFRCFGCDAGGGPIDWVMRYEGVSFRHAVELLRDGAVSDDRPVSAAPPVRSTVPKLAAPVSFDAEDAALLGQVINYYHETLKQTPEALDYLRSRGHCQSKCTRLTIEATRVGVFDAQTQEACQPVSIFSLIARSHPHGRDALCAVSIVVAECGGSALRARLRPVS